VLVTRRLVERVEDELRARFDVTQHASEEPPSRAELLAAVAGMAGLLTVPGDVIDGELLDAAGPGLRVVANHAVGYDNVDVDACTRRGVLVANTPGVLTLATAELTLALLLDLVRRVSEGDRLIRARTPWRLAPTFMLGTTLEGLTLGVVGLGRIGREVARLAEAFRMDVVYTAPSGARRDAPWRFMSLGDLLATADVVSLHCPLSAETTHLIGAAELARMKPTAVLVNTSRGPVVDEAALVEALRAQRIAGAALDVFEREPEVHAGLIELDTVVLCPHLGSATVATREAMGLACVEALEAVLLRGVTPPHALNAPSACLPA
jgi:glyoxylate reductase